MTDEPAFLTPHQLAQRWNGVVTSGTLANWRSKGVGPDFTKLRGRVLYPVASVADFEATNLRQAAQAAVNDGGQKGEAA